MPPTGRYVAMTRVRAVQSTDRAEWLRLLLEFYSGSGESDHVPIVDAYLEGTSCEWLVPAAVFVCERSGHGLCGLLELSVREYAEGCTGATPYVESWYVESAVRGSGIGRQLVEAAEHWALEKGYTELASDAELGNTSSHAAHQAVGFIEEERVVHFRKKLTAAAH